MIATKGLTVRFRGEARITYGDLTFGTGSCALLGASGCGKTTLLNAIAGVLTPTAGEVLIDGRNMAAAPQREKDDYRIRNIGFIYQDFKLLEDMTVEDNLRVLKLERVDVSGMDAVLGELGILPLKRRRVRKLSGGEKQRVAIARALVKRPEVILADEPTGNLNYEIGRQIVEKLLEVSRGRTLIAVTHDDRLAGLFDRVLDMNEIARAEVDDDA
ncbi:MAG: ATP-binding cassette domain-containing protein [Clostridiales bacterium]|nr:ATP-binding cassette domain-containing protein [Clostridiales bacterium]